MKFCATYEVVHSDQERAFESTILGQRPEAFGTKKTHTTPYYPQDDGMVERFSRSLLHYYKNLCRERRGLIVLLSTHLLGYHLLY